VTNGNLISGFQCSVCQGEEGLSKKRREGGSVDFIVTRGRGPKMEKLCMFVAPS